MGEYKGMLSILLKVSPELKEKLQAVAKKNKRSMQSQIAWMLEELLND